MGKSDPVYYAGTIEAFNTAFLTFIGEKFETGNIYIGFKLLYDLETIIYDYNLEDYKNDLKKIINDMTRDYEKDANIMKKIDTFLKKYFGIEEENVLFFDLFSKEINKKPLLLSCFPFMYKGKCNSDSNDECYLYKPYSEKCISEKCFREIMPERRKDVNNQDKIYYIPSLLDNHPNAKDKYSNRELFVFITDNQTIKLLSENIEAINKLYGKEVNTTNDDIELNDEDKDIKIENLYNVYLKKSYSMISDYEYIKNYQTIKFIVKLEVIFKRAIDDLMYLRKLIIEAKTKINEKELEKLKKNDPKEEDDPKEGENDPKGGKRRKSRRKNRSKKSKKSRKGRKTRRKSIRRHGRRN